MKQNKETTTLTRVTPWMNTNNGSKNSSTLQSYNPSTLKNEARYTVLKKLASRDKLAAPTKE